MKLRGVDFGPVWGASGVQGFFGEGYPYHKYLGLFRPNFGGMTFVAKTTTLYAREGNMPLLADHLTPMEFKPKCIVVKLWQGVTLNAVGLSGPGSVFLFESGRWQRQKKPFLVSFMSVEKERSGRLLELGLFVTIFKHHLSNFSVPVGLQINYSCPNTGHELADLAGEVEQGLEIASVLNIPLLPKFNVLLPVRNAVQIAKNKYCDGIVISNTIPWGQFPMSIDWEGLFGSKGSPLKQYGGGGLSGAPLLPKVTEWVYRAVDLGITKPINAGGGVLCADDVDQLRNAGASSVSLGSVAMLRPWRVQSIIKRAHKIFR